MDGTALYYALSLDQISTPIGAYLLNFPQLLEVMTFATFGLEAVGPFLLFCPFFTGPVRTGAVMAFMGLHFGILLTMDIGIFPWIGALGMVCFLPGWFWEKAAGLRAALPERMDAAARYLPHAAARMVQVCLSPVADSRQPSVADPAGRDDKQPESRIARVISFLPVGMSGRSTRRGGPTAEYETQNGTTMGTGAAMLRPSIATDLAAFVFLLYILFWNLTTVSAFTMPERAAPIGPFLGIDQYWGMFAPSPSKDDGWYVIPGTLRGEQQTDLMSVTRDDYGLHEVSWEKPRDVNRTYENEHWRKYLENIWLQQHASQRLHFGRYICREWNARHAGTEQLRAFQITYMLEKTLPDYQRSTPQKVVLWEHKCFQDERTSTQAGR